MQYMQGLFSDNVIDRYIQIYLYKWKYLEIQYLPILLLQYLMYIWIAVMRITYIKLFYLVTMISVFKLPELLLEMQWNNSRAEKIQLLLQYFENLPF